MQDDNHEVESAEHSPEFNQNYIDIINQDKLEELELQQLLKKSQLIP